MVLRWRRANRLPLWLAAVASFSCLPTPVDGGRAGTRGGSRAAARARGALPSSDAASSLVPEFFAPQLTPTQFLIVSSPSLRKVVYTELKNFKAKLGRPFALIDSGLEEPCGIAVDTNQGHLYVADRGARGIYRYTLIVDEIKDRDGSVTFTLATDGARLTILSNHLVEWVTVNDDGDVFYSDQGSHNINRITAATMLLLEEGSFQAEDLIVVSEKQLEAEAAAALVSTTATDAPEPSARILAIYESQLNPRVSEPAGIASDGLRLYWANQADGVSAGSVVQGEVNPHIPAGSTSSTNGANHAPFPANALSNVTAAAYGVAKTNNLILFSGNASSDGSEAGGFVFGRQLSGGDTYVFASGLGEPRGLVWDGDHTVFVADQAASTVFSFPAGRIIEHTPLTVALHFQGAYGVALLQASDGAFSHRGGAVRRSSLPGFYVIQLLAFSLLAAVLSDDARS